MNYKPLFILNKGYSGNLLMSSEVYKSCILVNKLSLILSDYLHSN